MSSSEKRVRDDRVLLDLLADKWTILSSDRCAIMTTGGGSMPFAATFRAFRRRASLNVCGVWKRAALSREEC